LPHKLLDDLIRTMSDLGIVGMGAVLCTLVLAICWICLPFFVCAVYRSTSDCRRELRALNGKLDQLLRTITVPAKVATNVSDSDAPNPITTNGKPL
jgi:hypothetical protein